MKPSIFIISAMVISGSLAFAAEKHSKKPQKAPPPKVNFDEETQAPATHASVKKTDDPVPYPSDELEKMDAAKQPGGELENNN